MNYSGVNMITCGTGNCYVIRGETGDLLIDTCTADYRYEIETWLQNYNVKLIAITHGHNDHTENAAYFSKLFKADIAMSAYDVKLSRDNTLHRLHTIGAMGKVISAASKKPMSKPAERFGVNIYLDDGMEPGKEYGINCKAVQLDGHTRGSFGFLCGEDFYIGDAAMNFLYPSFPAICESPRAARESLERIKQLRPNRVFFGHGKPVEAGTNDYRILMGI